MITTTFDTIGSRSPAAAAAGGSAIGTSTSGGVANAIVSRTRAALGLALLTGIGFTVSLLIGELAFGTGTAAGDGVKIGVLLGSLCAAALAAVVLRVRNADYRRLCADEERDDVHEP